MINTLREQITEALNILEEIRIYDKQKKEKKLTTLKLYKSYQNKELSYSSYQQLKDKILQNKTKQEWDEHYDSYIYNLLKKVELLNKSIALKSNHIDPRMVILSQKEIQIKKEQENNLSEQLIQTEEDQAIQENTTINFEGEIDEQAIQAEIKNNQSIHANLVEKTKDLSELSTWQLFKLWLKSFFSKKAKAQLATIRAKRKKPQKIVIKDTSNKKIKLKSIHLHENKPIIAGRHGQGQNFITKVISKRYLINALKRFAGLNSAPQFNQNIKKHQKTESIFDFIDETVIGSEDHSLLSDERERLNRFFNSGDLQTYSVSKFGTFANILFKKFTLYLLNAYPDVFKKLNDALRLADMKILSITYINMMLFSTIIGFFAGIPIFTIIFMILGSGFFLALFKGSIASLIFGIAVFIAFYSKPFSEINTRSKSIELNLPFAVNHLSSIASSGIAPARMFHLVSQSSEYKAISIELKKIVEYIEIFGYDLVTAIQTVAISTPNKVFKEFLEGFISNIQSGGELNGYLEQKSEELIDAYELKRQAYVETIATFSDIYTGAMIAAPLFFIITLSLVSVIGGQIGSIDVSLIILVGTYVIIPLINFMFMGFLQITALDN